MMEMLAPVTRDLRRYKKLNYKLFTGFKFSFKGRFQRRYRSKFFRFVNGSVALNSFSLFIEFADLVVCLRNSAINVSIWLARNFLFYQTMGTQISVLNTFLNYENTY